jgi:hypothetical protein
MRLASLSLEDKQRLRSLAGDCTVDQDVRSRERDITTRSPPGPSLSFRHRSAHSVGKSIFETDTVKIPIAANPRVFEERVRIQSSAKRWRDGGFGLDDRACKTQAGVGIQKRRRAKLSQIRPTLELVNRTERQRYKFGNIINCHSKGRPEGIMRTHPSICSARID